MRFNTRIFASSLLAALLAACSSTQSHEPVTNPETKFDYCAALRFGFAGYSGEFPATVASGHHGGAFFTWVSAEELKTCGSTLFDKYKDTPAPKDRTNLKPCILGAIAGEPVNHNHMIEWKTLSARLDGSRVSFVVQSELHFTISACVDSWGGYALDLSEWPQDVKRVSFHFTQINFLFGPNGGEQSDGVPYADFEIDIEALRRVSDTYSTELTGRRKVVEDYPQSDCAWSWEVAKNWRGIELLHGALIYWLGGKEHDLWNFRRGERAGVESEQVTIFVPRNDVLFFERKVVISGEFVGGKKNGVWRGSYDDGAKAIEETFADGIALSGTWWYPNGTVLMTFSQEGELTKTTTYFENGNPSFEGTTLGPTTKHGFHSWYWENGFMKEQHQYDHMQPTGTWRRWNKDGSLIEEHSSPPWYRR